MMSHTHTHTCSSPVLSCELLVSRELILAFDSVMCKNVLLRGLMPGSSWAFEGIQLCKWRQEQELGSSSRTGDDSLGNFGAATIEKWLGCSVCKTGTGMLAACLGQGCGRTTLSWSSRLWGMGRYWGRKNVSRKVEVGDRKPNKDQKEVTQPARQPGCM